MTRSQVNVPEKGTDNNVQVFWEEGEDQVRIVTEGDAVWVDIRHMAEIAEWFYGTFPDWA